MVMRTNSTPERFRNRKEALLWLQSRGQISQGKFYQDCAAGLLTIYQDKSLSKFQVSEYAHKIFGFARSLVGHIRGGLAHVVILNSMVFAGMSGAAVADVAGMGAMQIKAMTDNGYDKDFAAAVTAAGSTIAPIIPPSISMVVYGVLASTSVGALFMGGFIPGFLMGGFMMIYSYIMAIRRKYPLSRRATLREVVETFVYSIPGLMTPVILLSGIALGIVTPTEAAVVAVFYTGIVGFLVYKKLGVSIIIRILRETVQTTGVVCFVMTTASLFAWIMAREQVPQRFAEFVLSVTDSPAMFLLFAGILFVAVKVLGGEGRFSQLFAAILYAWIPEVIKSIISIAIIVPRGLVTQSEIMTLIRSNLGFLVDPKEHAALFTALAALDVFTIWTVVLLIIGASAASKLSKGKSAAIIVTFWLLFVLFGVGMAALRGGMA